MKFKSGQRTRESIKSLLRSRMEDQRLKLEILQEIRQIELDWANHQYTDEAAVYLLKKSRQLLEELSIKIQE